MEALSQFVDTHWAITVIAIFAGAWAAANFTPVYVHITHEHRNNDKPEREK